MVFYHIKEGCLLKVKWLLMAEAIIKEAFPCIRVPSLTVAR